MTTRHHSSRVDSRWRSRRSLIALVALPIVLLTACGVVSGVEWAVPQGVVNVPGNFTFTTTGARGNPDGRIYLCTATRTIVVVEASYQFFDPQVTWGGAPVSVATSHPEFPDYPRTTAAFGPVEAGCGEFASGAFGDQLPYAGPPAITFVFTTCDPNSTREACIASAP